MKISNEQRRNLASSLRHDAAYGEGSLSEWWGRLQFIVLGEEDFPNPKEVFEGLADLIDRPTCSNAYDDSGMHVAAHVTWFDCSECHCKVRTDMIGRRIRYCPNCGAEVVSDDD